MRILPRHHALALLSISLSAAPAAAWQRPPSSVLHTRADGSSSVCVLDEPGGRLTTALDDVTLMPIELVGYALKDRWRVNAPALMGLEDGLGTLRAHVRIPNGGSLYRVHHAGATAILHITPGGLPALLLSTPLDELQPALHVAPDGSSFAASTSAGHVYTVQLATGQVHRATPDTGLSGLAASSLRVSSDALWFVADGVLWRGAPQGQAHPVPLDEEHEDASVEAELALAPGGGALAAITRRPDGKGRIHLVPATGSALVVEDSAQVYSAPHYDHPLGPFLAVSNDAVLVAYRREQGNQHELYVQRMDNGEREHLTTGALFPAYVDNVGVFAFASARRLCFFGGDNHVSGVDPNVEFGNADMYVAELLAGQDPVVRNVTRTNGQSEPPFDVVPDLWLERVWVDAAAEHILFYGREEGGAPRLASFRTDGGHPSEPNLAPLLSGLGGCPTVLALGEGAVLLAHRQEADPPFSQEADRVECEGDPAGLPVVRLRASDKASPSDDSAKVWFDGLVELGALVDFDAAAEGESRLKSDTWVHVFDLADNLLQTVKLHTSCSQPLQLGDRFGPVRLIAAVGEDAQAAFAGDECQGYGDPRILRLDYHPATCDAGSHSQDESDVTCSGSMPGHGPVHLRATNQAEAFAGSARVWFDGDALPGAQITLDADNADRDKLDNETWLHVFGPGGHLLQSTGFDTSCSAPLVLDDRFGSFVLREVVFEDTSDPGDACADGKPVVLTMRYVGEGCAPLHFGPELCVARDTGPGGALAAAGATATTTLHFPRQARVGGSVADHPSGQAAFLVRRAAGRETLVRVHASSGRAEEVDEALRFTRPGFSSTGALVYARSEDGLTWELCLSRAAGVRVLATSDGPFEVLD